MVEQWAAFLWEFAESRRLVTGFRSSDFEQIFLVPCPRGLILQEEEAVWID